MQGLTAPMGERVRSGYKLIFYPGGKFMRDSRGDPFQTVH